MSSTVAPVERLTLLISPTVLIELKKAAVEERKTYSNLAGDLFNKFLHNGASRQIATGNGPAPDAERFTVYLPPIILTEFKKAAIERRTTYSSLAEEIFKFYVKKRKK